MKTRTPFSILSISFMVLSLVIFSVGAFSPKSAALPGFQSGVAAAVKGYVKDARTGETIPKAKILIIYSKSESVRYTLETDKKGYYYKSGLTPGYYRFRIEKEGFLPTEKTVRARLADTVQHDFELHVVEANPVAEAATSAKKAMKFFNEAKWDEAVDEFSEGISKSPENPTLYFYRGLSQENNGNIDEALADYEKAIELKPEFTLPYSRSGKIYARQQNHEKARELYQKAFELGDTDITTLYNYGVVLMNLGQSPDAKNVFEKLLEIDEDYPDAYYHLGIITIGQGDAEKAIELFKKFLELDPENPNAPVAQKILESLGG
jgi:tetratricopeptide (TPR) repeat protein